MSEVASNSTLAELAKLSVEGLELQDAGFRFGDFSVVVSSNSGALLDRLKDYFRANLAPASSQALRIVAVQAEEPDFGLEFQDWKREGGKVGRKEAFADLSDGRVIWKVRTGMQFLVGREVLLGIGNCLANDNQIINFVIAQYLSYLMNQGSVLCHAAGVVADGRGLAIAATSGAGKSTLALRLMSRGLNFVSNDRLLIHAGHMFGVPKQPRVNPGTLLNNSDLTGVLPERRVRDLKQLDRDALWQLEEKYDVDIERVYGSGRWTLSAPISAFVVLNWRRNDSRAPRFERVDVGRRPDVLELIMKGPGPFYMDSAGNFLSGKEPPRPGPYIEELSQVAVYEVTGGANFDAAGDRCLQLLAESR